MIRRSFLVLCFGLGLVRAARAQGPTTLRRIAHLSGLSKDIGERWLAAFRDGMRQLGYVEERDFTLESRFAAGDFARLASQAAELTRAKPHLFLVYGAEAAQAAAKAAPTLPIVLANAQDPVASGLVANLARPGGNITGMSDDHSASSTKRLELLKEALPGLSRVALFWRAGHAAHPRQVPELQAAGRSLGLAVVPMEVVSMPAIEQAFTAMKRENIGAVLMLGDAFLSAHMGPIIDLGFRHRIVAMYTTRAFAQAGGMIAYGADIGELVRRSAKHVDRIFKGAKPGDLPIELPVKFDLVLNAKSAKALGVTLPRSLLLRADHVIE